MLEHEHNQQIESINKTKNDRLEEVLKELSDSTLRCSRQQSIIENHQDTINQQSVQIDELKSTNLSLQTDMDKNMMLSMHDHHHVDKDSEVKQLREEIILLQKHLVSSKDTVAQLQSKLADSSIALQEAVASASMMTPPDDEEGVDAWTQTRRVPGIDNISQVNLEDLMQESPLHPAKSGDEAPSTETILLTYQFLR